MIEKISLAQALGQLESTNAPDNIIGTLGGSGIKTPSAPYVRRDQEGIVLGHNTLVHVAEVSVWNRFAFMCVIGNTYGSENCILSVTGTFSSTSVYIKANKIGNAFPSSVHIYYKVEDNKMHVYLYSTINTESIIPFVIMSSHPVTSTRTDDVSGMTEVQVTDVS